MQELLLLGLAIEKIEYLLPREMWSILPGGMPYIKIREYWLLSYFYDDKY